MRNYSQFSPTFWTRGSGKNLRGDPVAQVLAVYLFTSPHANMTGIYHVALPTVAHEIGQPVDDVREALSRISDIAVYDEDAELAWVPALAKHQVGEDLKPTDKRRRAIEKALEQAGNHPFVLEFIRRYGARYGLKLKTDNVTTDAPSMGEDEDVPEGHPRTVDAPGSRSVPVPVPVPEGVQGAAPTAASDGQQANAARRDPFMESMTGRRAQDNSEVKSLFEAWKDAHAARGSTFRNPVDVRADILFESIKSHGLQACLDVLEASKTDGMVTGKTDERGAEHRSVEYIFKPTTFDRLLRAAEKMRAERPLSASETVRRGKQVEPDLSDWAPDDPRHGRNLTGSA